LAKPCRPSLREEGRERDDEQHGTSVEHEQMRQLARRCTADVECRVTREHADGGERERHGAIARQ